MDKYTDLRDQVINETRWCIDSILENHPGIKIPVDYHISDFIGNPVYARLTDYERGMMFAYLSMMSKIKALEG